MVAASTEASVEVVAIVAYPHRYLHGREVLQAKLPQTTIGRVRLRESTIKFQSALPWYQLRYTHARPDVHVLPWQLS